MTTPIRPAQPINAYAGTYAGKDPDAARAIQGIQQSLSRAAVAVSSLNRSMFLARITGPQVAGKSPWIEEGRDANGTYADVPGGAVSTDAPNASAFEKSGDTTTDFTGQHVTVRQMQAIDNAHYVFEFDLSSRAATAPPLGGVDLKNDTTVTVANASFIEIPSVAHGGLGADALMTFASNGTGGNLIFKAAAAANDTAVYDGAKWTLGVLFTAKNATVAALATCPTFINLPANGATGGKGINTVFGFVANGTGVDLVMKAAGGTGYVLTYDGTNWVGAAPAAASSVDTQNDGSTVKASTAFINIPSDAHTGKGIADLFTFVANSTGTDLRMITATTRKVIISDGTNWGADYPRYH